MERIDTSLQRLQKDTPVKTLDTIISQIRSLKISTIKFEIRLMSLDAI